MPNHKLKLSWHDAFLSKMNNRPVLHPTPQIINAWREAGLGDAFPNLHISLTHDGNYITAFVIAETANTKG